MHKYPWCFVCRVIQKVNSIYDNGLTVGWRCGGDITGGVGERGAIHFWPPSQCAVISMPRTCVPKSCIQNHFLHPSVSLYFKFFGIKQSLIVRFGYFWFFYTSLTFSFGPKSKTNLNYLNRCLFLFHARSYLTHNVFFDYWLSVGFQFFRQILSGFWF